MDEGINTPCDIVVNDGGDRGDIQSSCRDIGGHQDGTAPFVCHCQRLDGLQTRFLFWGVHDPKRDDDAHARTRTHTERERDKIDAAAEREQAVPSRCVS